MTKRKAIESMYKATFCIILVFIIVSFSIFFSNLLEVIGGKDVVAHYKEARVPTGNLCDAGFINFLIKPFRQTIRIVVF